MNKKNFVLLNLVLMLVSSHCVLAQESSKFYSIQELNRSHLQSGAYTTEGFVVKISTCPPCPKNAICEVCEPDNIVVSEKNKKLDEYTLSERDLVIFVKNSKLFKVGKKYKFQIEINNYRSANQVINRVELIDYKLLK